MLSESRGRFQAAARSSRKLTAKTMGRLEPGMEIDVSLAEGKSLDVVTEVRTVAAHAGLRADLSRLAYAMVVLELFETVSEPGTPEPGLVPLLSAVLHLLESDADARLVLGWAFVRLTSILGLSPEVKVCGTCRRALDETTAWFSVGHGSMLCPSCRREDASAFRIHAGTLALYAQLQRCDVLLVPRLRAETVVLRQLEEVMHSHLSYRWPHRLKSVAFLAQVQGLQRRE